MKICVRDITVNRDFPVELPVSETEFNNLFNEKHEYIIIEYDGVMKPDELSNIRELNNFLLECAEEGISKETLRILSTTFYYNEVIEKVRKEDYAVYPVDDDTENWHGVSGRERCGLYMYEQGYNEFPCEVPEELLDYIDWEANWTSLECSGWQCVTVGQKEYIVR